MPLEFRMTVPNMTQFGFALRQIPIRDWSEAWPKVIKQLEAVELGMFVSQGATGVHGRWAELDPGYAERKARKYPGKTILRAGDRLYDSLRGKTGDTVDERWPDKLRWGTRVGYALFQQMGFRTRLGTGKGKPKEGGRAFVPARRMFDLGLDDRKAFLNIFQATAANIFRRRGYAIAKEFGFAFAGPGEARTAGRSIYESEQVRFPT